MAPPELPNQEETIKVATWNINGLRAALKKGTLEAFLRQAFPDILALSELKITTTKLNKVLNTRFKKILTEMGYTSVFHCCDIPESGYSGVGILSRVAPRKVWKGWERGDGLPPAPDEEARVVTCFFDSFILVNTYTPCTGFDHRFEAKRKTFDGRIRAHLEHLNSLNEGKVIWCGDLNTAVETEDVFSVSREGWPGRYPWERDVLTQHLQHLNMCDAFQTLHPTVRGKERFTFYENGAYRLNAKGWRLDYFITPPELLKQTPGELYIHDIRVEEDYEGSDHVPLTMQLRRASPPDTPSHHPEAPNQRVFEHGDNADELLDTNTIAVCSALATAALSDRNPWLDKAGLDPDMEPAQDDPTRQVSHDAEDTDAKNLQPARTTDCITQGHTSYTVPVTTVRLNGVDVPGLWDTGS